ncbi:hypothetical protein AB0876_10625 [Mycobacterium sp. NPDC049093]
MKVEQVSEDFWRVTEGNKSWTAKTVANFGLRYWVIDNSRGTRLDPGGPTGRRVIAAIRNATPI